MYRHIIVDGSSVTRCTLDAVRKWQASGGAVFVTGEVRIFETGETIENFEMINFAPVETPIYKTAFASADLFYNPLENRIYTEK